jgi:RNA polymerase sigma factor (sigma-70 family)
MSLATGALLKTQSDTRLCRLTGEGYEAAFEVLVSRYRAPLHRYARRFLTDAAAEDVVQQAFMDLWAALSDGESIRNVRAWLYRVVRNCALNTIRRAGYRHDEPQEAPGADSPELAFERTSAVREALDGLTSLPALQREAIVRAAVDGNSRGEIGTAMGLSDGAVGMLLYRARSTLRCAMSAVVPFPLITWVAGGRGHDPSAAARLLQLTAAGADSGPAVSVLLRGGATVAVIAATAAPLVAPHASRHSDATAHSAVPIAAGALISGPSDPLQPFLRPRPELAPALPAASTTAHDHHVSPAPLTAGANDAAAGVEDTPAQAAEAPPQEASAPGEPSAEASEAPPPAQAAASSEAPAEAAPAAEAVPPAEPAPPAQPEAASAPPAEAPPSAA